MAFAHYKVELYLLYSFQLNLCQVWARIGSMFHVLCLFCFASWIPLHSHTHNHTYHIYWFINLNTHIYIYMHTYFAALSGRSIVGSHVFLDPRVPPPTVPNICWGP
jgi:hypothetical protein